MKIFKTLAVFFLCLAILQVNAQTEAPKGFKKGTITLADNSSLSGFIKDNLRSNASIVFISEGEAKKKKYDGVELLSASIDSQKYLCIHGDFFKVISEGELNFLQKSSDASGKPSYNGNDAVFSNGTEGKPNDYFIYDNKTRQLRLVSRKNLEEVISASFTGNPEAIDKAKTVNGDLSQLKGAVELYNKNNK